MIFLTVFNARNSNRSSTIIPTANETTSITTTNIITTEHTLKD